MLAASPGLQAVDANAETLMLLPYTAAGLLMWRWARGEDVRRPWLEGAIAGALTVVAIMTKQVAGVLLFQLAVTLVLRKRDVLALAGSFVAAAAAATLATAGWVTYTGQLREWIVYGWLQNFMYAQNAAGPDRLRGALDGIWRLRAVVLAPLVLTTAIAAWPQRDRAPARRADTWFALWWLLLSAVPTAISGFFFPHYFIQLIPAIALLGALAATRMLAWRENAGRTRLATAVSVFAIAATLAGPALHLAKAYAVYPQLPIPSDSELKPEIAAWVRSLTKPSDRVLMWSHLRGLSVYADRRPANAVPEASLYTMRQFTIYGRSAGKTVLGVTLVEPMDTIIAQWHARPPDAILVTTETGQTLEDLARESGLRDDAALIELLRGYREVGRRSFGGNDAVVYARS
jgi:4-amino-4-deoxy-L-arabinose transferase-like glycosyltransferase